MNNRKSDRSILYDIGSDLERQAVERVTSFRQDDIVNFDALTGLPNRTLFRDRLEHAVAQGRRHRRLVGLIFLDLDRFKAVNDSLGDTVGDRLLQAVTERLRSYACDGDTIARLGGDEFAIILEGIMDIANAENALQDLVRAMEAPFKLEGHDIFVTISAGITIYPTDAEDIDGLITNADTAMYRAKEQGRNNWQFYTEDMNTLAIEKLVLQNNLRQALKLEQFLLFFQPQIDLRSGDIVGMEALIRWQHPELGLLSPLKFIPVAEESGLIVPIGDWVLREACRQIKAWRKTDMPAFRVSVNLSASQFRQHDLVDTIAGIIQEAEIDPGLLELEITEGVLVEDVEQAIKVLHGLHEMGIQLSIDDFGTGYSSLSYLKQFPLNTLKIDRSFIQDITIGADDAAITEAVIALGHSLGLKVIAEGVEAQEQLSFLIPRGCDQVQGYLFSRPMPAPAVAAWMQKRPLKLSAYT